MKRESVWDPDRYLNIWVMRNIITPQNTDTSFVAGYSFYPHGVAGTKRDGIVIRYNFFGRRGRLANKSLNGRTATHEVGHYLNLLHPWGRKGGCDTTDWVDDTPPCKGAFFAAPPDCKAPRQCGFRRQIENYMDYSADKCLNMFTLGQTYRMLASLIHYRSSLISESQQPLTNCAAEDSFIARPSGINTKISLYPNPAQQKVLVYPQVDTIEQLKIEVYSMKGQLVYSLHRTYGPARPYLIDFSQRGTGVYLFDIQVNELHTTRQVLVIK